MPSISSVFDFLLQGINACFDWFDSLFGSGEWYYLILGIVLFFLLSRLIIAPLFGSTLRSAGSDRVKKNNRSTEVEK